MYIYTLVTITMYIYMVTVACQFIILLISRSHLFFSLFSVHNELSNFSSPHFLVPHMHTNTPTRKHIHTDKLTQRYTNTPTHKQINKETDWCLIGACGTIDAWLERSVLMGLAWSVLVGLAWLKLVRLAWSVLDRVWSELVGLAWLELGRFDRESVDYTKRENCSVFKNGYRDRYRESNKLEKMGRERERESTYVKGIVEKINYLNKINSRIDGLMWNILKSGYIK